MTDTVSKVLPDEGYSEEKTDKEICRICLQHGDTPLKKKCKCNVKTHDLCIAYWIKTRPKGENTDKMRCEVCHSPYIIDESIKRLICNKKDEENDELSIEIITSNNNQSNCHPICICLSLFCGVVIPIWSIYWFVNVANDENGFNTQIPLFVAIYLTVGSFLALAYGAYKDLYGNNNNN